MQRCRICRRPYDPGKRPCGCRTDICSQPCQNLWNYLKRNHKSLPDPVCDDDEPTQEELDRTIEEQSQPENLPHWWPELGRWDYDG